MKFRRLFAGMVLVLVLAGCGDDAPTVELPTAEPVQLAGAQRLARISVALTGHRPLPEDIARVEQDPAALDTLVDAYMATDEFGATMRELHNDSLLLFTDYFLYPAGFPPIGPLAGVDVYDLNRSVMEAPLRLIEHVVANDLPYTEIVTADYTLANDQVAAVWGLPYNGDGEWAVTQWVDGREQAGILSDSWLYQRHASTISNVNRGRANAVSRALLCYDFASRDIRPDASVDLSDPEVVANAVQDNAACASCHQTLDPLASFFRSFIPLRVPTATVPSCDPLPPEFSDPEECQSYPLFSYLEDLFPLYLDVPVRDPVFFGTAGDEIASLGSLIADDPRFSLCAAQRFYAFFHQVNLEAVPFESTVMLRDVLVDSGMNAKAMVKAIMLSDGFAVSHAEPLSSEVAPQDDVVGVKKTRPEQLARMVQQLTGYRWRVDLNALRGGDLPDYGLGRIDMMEDSFVGYQVLAGGVDGIFTTRPSRTFGATTSLVVQNLAQLAAENVVENDFSGGARRLLSVSEGSTDETQVREELASLQLKLFSERLAADDPQTDAAYALWSGALDHTGSPRRAWKITLTAMLQDARFVFY